MENQKVAIIRLRGANKLKKKIEETMVTKAEFTEANSRMTTTLDEVLKIVKDTQQEMVMMRHGMNRMQTQVDRHEEDITRMKPLVGLV